MPFDAFDVSLDMIRSLREPLAAVAERDPALAQQLRRAAASVPLNLSEGRRRNGRDRLHLWRIAAGSADEVVASLRVAEAWGHVDGSSIAPALTLCDRVLAMLWRLTR
jgi:four helix bundle protein